VRAQMAAFLARAMAGSDAAIPVSGSVVGKGSYNCVSGSGSASLFADVAPYDTFCRHIHYIAAAGVTLGCDATHFCPDTVVTRAQMAMFVARAVAGSDAAVPTAYTDPDTGFTYNCGTPPMHFTDVAASAQYCRHAHYLWAKAIEPGCSENPAMYCPVPPTLRQEMARFIVNGWRLQLYGQ
jgi:hypothetical protein